MNSINIHGNKEIIIILKLLFNIYSNKSNLKLIENNLKQTSETPFIYGSSIKVDNDSEIYLGTSEFVLVTNKNSEIKDINLELLINLINSDIPREKNDIKLLINSNNNYINHLKNLNLLVYNNKCINYDIINDNIEIKNKLIENKNYIGIISNIFYLDYKEYLNKINLSYKNQNNVCDILSYNLYLYSNIMKFKNDYLVNFYNFLKEQKNISKIINKLGYIIKSDINNNLLIENYKTKNNILPLDYGINTIDTILNEFNYDIGINKNNSIIYKHTFNIKKDKSNILKFYLKNIEFYSTLNNHGAVRWRELRERGTRLHTRDS